ncbi:FMN-dependent NADH-azoreductase [Actinoalloteichus hoggarensis]|uniref:FMN dependent NADH:quinone oxidoreductase n=1 Tax=Actinoalloteichus hoggarensis TaxID=1470176 RepID=A0A221W9H2_9PSEU|nr:NAD(P)H-dependent oxidoreductase [Actinoalloteichus hoggarensis]ASO22658.1 FMN-dependent NADH-azoreductase [Actinoalloteichus hoggarensis]MBB5924200.1 FMN-dependent NADH-azoreductase [Actinoalloteichus hoggarensis]
MADLLHISASPRGGASRSLALASGFTEAYQDAHPDAHVLRWDLWDGSLPEFGPAAAHAKMANLAGDPLTPDQESAYQKVRDAFARFDAVDRYLFSVPMWNGTVPYILKQFIDVVSQPGLVFEFDPETGYTGLLTGKKAVVLYTSAVWAPGRPPAFGSDFQQPYVENWLRWAGVSELASIRLPAAAGTDDPDVLLRRAHAELAAAAVAL